MRFDEKVRRLLKWSRRSLRELASELELPATTVSNWVNAGCRPRHNKLKSLEEWIEREFGVSIEIGDLTNEDVIVKWKGGRPVFVEQSSLSEPFDGHPRFVQSGIDDMEVCELPIVGQVPAGRMADMTEDVIGSCVVPKSWTGGIDGCFCLRIWGDSMEPTLRDGELIVCDAGRAAFPRDGQIVVARFEGEAVVKEYQSQDTQILLIPHNRDYTSVSIRPDQIEIVAVVIGRWQAMPNV